MNIRFATGVIFAFRQARPSGTGYSIVTASSSLPVQSVDTNSVISGIKIAGGKLNFPRLIFPAALEKNYQSLRQFPIITGPVKSRMRKSQINYVGRNLQPGVIFEILIFCTSGGNKRPEQ